MSPTAPAADVAAPALHLPRTVRAPRGTEISCLGWQQEAALRMLMNNLDPEVAERPAEVVNVNGGACAMGHPVGATGARILVTLIHALRARGLRRGLASLCIGGGEATAMAIEVL